MTDKKQSLEEKLLAEQQRSQKKQAQIKAQLQAIKAREKDAERKKDTRRKIIAGGLVFRHAERNPQSEIAKKLTALIDEYVVKDKDRALFDLEALPQAEQETRLARHKLENKRKEDFNELTD